MSTESTVTTPSAPALARPLSQFGDHRDELGRGPALLAILLAALGGGLVTLAGWVAFRSVSLPAFSTSMVTRALATVGIVATLVVVGILLFVWIRDEHSAGPRPRWRAWLTTVVSYLSPALLVLSSIGLPLSASRLWLDGIQVDQVFRTQFLTRMADTATHADMNYLDLPTFYPMGWFWLGGRLANVLGIPGWEVFQPWALISLALCGCLLVPLWQRLVGSLPVATAIALATTAVTLTIGAEEPYSAVIAMGVPAAAFLCSRAFHGSWLSTLGLALFLGASASFYTLFTGAISLTVVSFVAIITAVLEHRWEPIVRLVCIGVGSLTLAAICWGPYVLGVLRSDVPINSAAQHYLPEEGTQIPVPFLAPTIIGLLCLIGLVYLFLRQNNRDIRTLGWALGGAYLWIAASMVLTLLGSTLLGFRLEILVVLIMATAGILALAELRMHGIDKLWPQGFNPATNRRITAAFMAVLALGGVFYAQRIPEENESAIDHAYTDTDGYGERADRYTSDSSGHYQEVQRFLEVHGVVPNETVMLTDEKLFMAYHPYWGFNAFTSHYANPLGQFDARSEQIETWANDSWDQTPEEFLDALDSAPWRGPDAMLFRGSLEDSADGFKTHLAEDIYPNQPNVRYRAVFFDSAVFDEAHWAMEQIGPFVVAVRTD